MIVSIPKDPLPWSVCPLNSNRTGYDEECEKASTTQYFWYRKTLNISPSIQDSGGVQWEPALCLILAWLVVYLCILRGTASTGKVGRQSMSGRPWGQAGGWTGGRATASLPEPCPETAFCSRGAEAVPDGVLVQITY